MGVSSRLLRAIFYCLSLLRAYNLLTASTDCRTLANPFPPILAVNAGLTLHAEFPFLHQLHTHVPFRNTSPAPFLHLRLPALSSRLPWARRALCAPHASPGSKGPEQRCTLPLRNGGPPATNQPLHNSVRRSPPFVNFVSPFPPIHFSYPSHSFFLLWKLLFPFDASFPLALPLHC